MVDDLTLEECEIECTHLEYCTDHYALLMNALLDRSLHDHISRSPEEMVDKLEGDRPDVGLEATCAITSSALSLFGPEAVMNLGGCPVCAFHNIIDHVADHMAVKYKRSN